MFDELLGTIGKHLKMEEIVVRYMKNNRKLQIVNSNQSIN